MTICPTCQTALADGGTSCPQCGQPCANLPPTAPGVTLRWSGLPARPAAPLQRSVAIEALFADKERVVIGRAPDCDVCLPHPSVSRYHALLERRPDGLRLRDLASVNGVSVGGRRLTEPVRIGDGERVGIGPYLFTLSAGVIHSLDSSRSLRLEAHHLEKVVPVPGGTRKLLDDVNLVVEPGEFVGLLGPSGSGKSTLMDCLNGRRRATGGAVRANGEDFYRHFDSFRQSLGYVPQKDIVHTQLSVWRALLYTARLRLPTDTDPAELHARVEKVLRLMELGPHRDTLVGNLSGGQIKRVSLGAELLAEPCLLYVDEATSGLDAGTEARMMRLFRQLADEGRSIVCITHNVDNVDRCHLVLVLARGKLVFYGPPQEALPWFGVRRLGEVYDRLAEKDVAQWEKEYAASPLCQEFVLGRLAVPATPEHPAAPADEKPDRPLPQRLSDLLIDGRKLVYPSSWPPLAERFRALTARHLRVREILGPLPDQWHQLVVLTARYVELLLGDRRSLRLLLLQAPVVALFILAGFVHRDFTQRVSAIDAFMGADGQPTPEAVAFLHDFHGRISLASRTVEADGDELLDLYRQVRARGPGLPAEPLARAPVEVTFRGERLTLGEDDWPRLKAAFERPNPRYTYILLFILVMIVLWFGCNNAAKEIVKEEAIYGRERAVNLGIVPYLASKFLVLCLLTVVQTLLLLAVVYGVLEGLAHFLPGHTLPPVDQQLSYLGQLGVLALLSATGVALGLLLSACVSSADRANALLPYVLIPQMILGGGILNVHEGGLHYLAVVFSPVYWAYRAVRLGASALPTGFPGHAPYADGVVLPCAALLTQAVVLLVLTTWFLRCKDA